MVASGPESTAGSRSISICRVQRASPKVLLPSVGGLFGAIKGLHKQGGMYKRSGDVPVLHLSTPACWKQPIAVLAYHRMPIDHVKLARHLGLQNGGQVASFEVAGPPR